MSMFNAFLFSKLMNPWVLLLLLPVLAVFVLEVIARAPGAVSISTGETLARVRGMRREWLRRLPAILRMLGLALLVLALARPMTGFQLRKNRADIVDIMLCVDVSGSMRSVDFIAGGERRDRLFVTKQAVRDFLQNRKENAVDRYGLDRIGLVLYATYAWTACPLTLDYGVLERELDRVDIDVEDPKRNHTAIGSAIGLAVSRLTRSEAKSKVIILLTDGLNNTGELDPITAARLAKEYGIRIYTIGAGSTQGGIVPTQTLFGTFLQQTTEGIDEETLKKIASATGGKYYRASDTESLEKAYQEINQLETTQVDLDDYYEHRDSFVSFAVAGAALLLAAVFVRRQWFEVIP
jgi:Ca-activated chloride channel family protein